MAFRPLLTKRTILQISTIGTGVLASNALFTQNVLHTEAATPIGWESIEQGRQVPQTTRYRTSSPKPITRKPIYDDPPASPSPVQSHEQSSLPESAQPTLSPEVPSQIRNPSEPEATKKTAITQLASHIRLARLFLHAHVAAGEDKFNATLDKAFELENNFTTTIANLAPSPESGEKLLPGAIYVLVAGMGGSILTRNRGLLLRATGPLALGVTAGWVLLPHTMRNVGDLIWKWEERVPAVANNHLLVRGFLVQGRKEVEVRGEQFGNWLEGVARQGREGVEGLIAKTR